MRRPTPPAYKTRNCPSYNEALKRRSSLTIWFNPAMTWQAAPTGKRGRHPDYSDAAIQTCLTMKVLFGMALRQVSQRGGRPSRRHRSELDGRPFKPAGKRLRREPGSRLTGLDWAVPDFSTLSRRHKTLKVNIPWRWSRPMASPW